MLFRRRPTFLLILLLAIGLRVTLGAPCCMEPLPVQPQTIEMADPHHHPEHAPELHDKHGDDPSANPCCSACGPTLPPDPALIASGTAPLSLSAPAPIRELATRPPFPAYDATGPPLRI